MIDLANRALFEPVTHPASGITSYLLTRRVAPVQQGFYFVNDSMSADGRLIVGDSNTRFHRGCASTVHLLNRDSVRCITIAENPERVDYAGRNYHIDPHPRFCCGDRYVVYTTTVRGEVDVAIVPVEELAVRSE